ncbi:MAG: ribosome biogenesis GTPase Der [Pseudomonadota bacterium]
MLPKIALVGRPNVGKSTLFNRLIRSNRAITHDRPGVTRDRMEGIVRGRGKRHFTIIDTGGITLDEHAVVAEGPAGIRGFEAEILRQAQDGMAESVAVCLVVDGRDGMLPFDEHLASYLRRTGKPVLLVVNKVDGMEKEEILTAEFHIFGFPIVAVSAEHGHNLRYLEEELRDLLPEPVEGEEGYDDEDGELALVEAQAQSLDILDGLDVDALEEEAAAGAALVHDGTTRAVIRLDDGFDPNAPLRLCLAGRPNAGKSSLVNALTGQQRMIVSDVAGTTRDSVDVTIEQDGRQYTFVDTAGIRRRARITDTVERYSVNSSIKSTTKADVTLLVLDGSEGITQQDKRLIDLLDERKTPFMVLVNKTDLVPHRQREQYAKDFRAMFNFCQHVPLFFISAQSGLALNKILPMATMIREECHKRVPTSILNRAMDDVLARHQPPVVRRVRPKFFYMTQAETAPPTFVIFVNDAERILDSYARYIEKSLRRLFGVENAPMRVHFRSSHKKRRDKK